jgi:hypothetical protein
VSALLPLVLALAAAVSPDLPEAQRHFRSGVDSYAHGEFPAAYLEFRRAYALAPSYKLLYNLGQVAFQVQDYAAALDYFERYLAEGKDELPEARRADVKRTMDELWLRVAVVEFVGVETDAELFVDDARISIGPPATPVRVKAGRSRIEVVPLRGARRSQVAELAAGERTRLDVRASSKPIEAPPPAPAPKPAVAVQLAAPPPVEPSPSPSGALVLTQPSPPAPARSGRRVPWATWVATGALAAGAAVTGVIAYRESRELDSALERYPADSDDLEGARQNVRMYSLVTDGLLVGTALLGALSIYLSLRPEAH